MRYFFITIMIFLSFSAFTQDRLRAKKKDVEALTKLNSDWLSLSMKKDTAAFAKIFAEDFVLTSPNGARSNKTNVVNNILHQDLKSINIDSMDVRLITNEVGLVTCYITYVFTNDDKVSTGRNCYQDVYVKRAGEWHAIAAHVALLGIQ